MSDFELTAGIGNPSAAPRVQVGEGADVGEIEYIFGTGDGAVSNWATPADLDLDGDGGLDAVVLDFDGDALIDDALWDSDGDGVADIVIVDFRTVDVGEGSELWERGDGPSAAGFAQWYTDPDGDGTWSGYRQASPDPAPFPGPVVVAEPTPAVLVDSDGDGVLDTGLTDTDGDGLLDTASAASVRLRAGGWWEWGVTRR